MTLFQKTAEKLAADIRRHGKVVLPGIRALTAQYDVCFNTMLKAMHLLVGRGIITMDGKRRARVVGAEPDPKETILEGTGSDQHQVAAIRLATEVQNQIRNGLLKVGNPLPKIYHYVTEYRLSRTTVTRALQQLASRGLVHKQGKTWIAGTPPPCPVNHNTQRGAHAVAQ